MSEKIAVIRTTDRSVFRTCRRRWDLSSHLRQNLAPKAQAKPLWLGSGVHYALEDFYGYKYYGSARKAFEAYIYAWFKFNKESLPEDWELVAAQGIQMLEYFEIWLEDRDVMPTYYLDGKPQVEVNIKIEIPKDMLPNASKIEADKVFYSLTLDRVSYDKQLDGLWVVEYKTAAQIQTTHFINDPQTTAYIWAAEQVFPLPILGVCYQQHKKQSPKPGKILKNGSVSSAQNQATSRKMYKKTLEQVYGNVQKAPAACVALLNELAGNENQHYDNFLRRDFIYRNEHVSKAEVGKILMETSEMLDPNLNIYPNPSRMCSMMCSFVSVCTSMDDGSDYKEELETLFESRYTSYDEWRKFLPDPLTFKGIKLTPAIQKLLINHEV